MLAATSTASVEQIDGCWLDSVIRKQPLCVLTQRKVHSSDPFTRFGVGALVTLGKDDDDDVVVVIGQGESIRNYIGIRRCRSSFFTYVIQDDELQEYSKDKPDFNSLRINFHRVEYACVYDDKPSFIEIVNNGTKYQCLETQDDFDSLWCDLFDGETKPVLKIPPLLDLYRRDGHCTVLAYAAEAHAHRISRGVGVGDGVNHRGPNNLLPLNEALDSRDVSQVLFKPLMGHKHSDFAKNGRFMYTQPEWGLLGHQPLHTLLNPRVNTSKEAETTLECGSHMRNNVPRLSASPVPLWSLRGLGVFSLASKRWIRVL